MSRRARVLHLDDGLRSTQDRYQALARGMGLSAEDVRGHLRFLPSPGIRLTDPGARDAYRRAVEGWDVCFLDSRIAVAFGVHERDAVICDCLDQVLAPVSEDTGCAFVVVHHTSATTSANLAGSGSHSHLRFALGSSGRAARTRSEVSTQCDRPAVAHELRRVTVESAAQFYLEFVDVPGEPNAGVRVVHRPRVGLLTDTSADNARLKTLLYLREQTIAEHPVRGVEAVARAIHMHRQRASDAVRQLERDGLVVNEPEATGRGAPKPRLYACSSSDFTRPPPVPRSEDP